MHRILECLFCWGNPPANGDLRDAQIILTQANADLLDGSPSMINTALAYDAKGYHEQYALPIFAQGEVARILKGWDVELIGETACQLTLDISSPQYGDTHCVAFQQKKLCDEKGFTVIIPIAPTPHLWRVIWVYRKLGLTVIIPQDLRKMIYQKDLASKYWRYPIRAHVYELLARFHFLYKDYI